MAAKELAAHKEGWRGKAGSLLADARVLASHPVYVLTVAGTAIYVGADPPAGSPLRVLALACSCRQTGSTAALCFRQRS